MRPLCLGLVLMICPPLAAQEAGRKGADVRHPNLLLNRQEIGQVKQKVREHAWAARLLDRVKAKAEQDGAAVETALAYALTGEATYARKGAVQDQVPTFP